MQIALLFPRLLTEPGTTVPVVFGVILGTGVGAGIVVNGKLVQGPNGISGEWGHNTMPEVRGLKRGRECFCGRLDCVETWISGPGLAKTYATHSQKTLSAREIAALDASGESMARQVLDQYFEQLAGSLAAVINILDPDTIVLGGGVSNTREALSRSSLQDREVRFLRSCWHAHRKGSPWRLIWGPGCSLVMALNPGYPVAAFQSALAAL